jgi:pyruvate dehydrogenase E2 component (dihydrolipoamide acetyltransferase)
MSIRVATRAVAVPFAAALLGACGMLGPDRTAVVVTPPPPPPTMMQSAAPQQMAPLQVAPAPAPAAAPAPARSAALAGHLASYKSAESAQAGWQQLVRRQPALQTLKPYFVPVTISGQPWVRVLAGDFPNAEEVNRFCNWARAQSLYCVPMPVNGASQAAPPRATAPAAARPRQPRGTPQPAAPAAAPAPMTAPAAPSQSQQMIPAPAPAAVAPPPASNGPTAAAPTATQPLAPPLPPRRQPTQPAVPQ